MSAAEEIKIVSVDDIEVSNPEKAFTPGGLKPVVETAQQFFDEIVNKPRDLRTKSGRKEIASDARKFGSLASRIEKMGVDVRKKWRAKADACMDVQKECVNEIRHMQSEIRKDLDKWEAGEKERLEELESRVKEIVELGMAKMTPAPKLEASQYKERLDALSSIEVDESFEELQPEAEEEYLLAKQNLEALHKQAVEDEEQKAELERLRQEQAKAEQEKLIKEREEKARKEAQEKADKEKQEAIEKFERETKEKAEAERKKKEAEEAEAERKAQNVEHQKKINNEALNSLMIAANLDEQVARKVIKEIARGNVQHVQVNY